MENIVELPRQPRSLSRLIELVSQCDDKRDFDRLGLTVEEERLLAQTYREQTPRSGKQSERRMSRAAAAAHRGAMVTETKPELPPLTEADLRGINNQVEWLRRVPKELMPAALRALDRAIVAKLEAMGIKVGPQRAPQKPARKRWLKPRAKRLKAYAEHLAKLKVQK